MSWAAWLCQTMTGEVGPRLPIVSGSVQHTLGDIGSWTLRVDGQLLDRMQRRWWYPWVASALICHRAGDDDPWSPVMFGPVTTLPLAEARVDGEAGVDVTLRGQDMRGMLARRLLTGHRDWPVPESTWALQHESLRMTKMSLGTIAEKIVAISTQRRQGGALPIRYDPALWQAGLPADDAHTRQYDAWQLPTVSQLLDDLSGCQGGPDIVFDPRCEASEDGQPSRAWVLMRHGLEGQPQIPQDRWQVWDARQPSSPVVAVSWTAEADAMWTRHWATGEGVDADVLMDVRQADDLLSQGVPLMETVTAYSSVRRHSTLLSHIDESLARSRRPAVEWTLSVDTLAAGCRPGVDWSLGERVRLLLPPTRARAVAAGSLSAVSGPAEVDMLATVTGVDMGLSGQSVTVHVQEDV